MHTIDYHRCGACGTCVSVCPVGALTLNDSGQPFLSENNRESCVSCGHCEAICPKGAVTLTGELLQPAVTSKGRAEIQPGPLSDYFRMRRSIRQYRDEAAPREMVERILDVVRYSPSGVNIQPVRWIVLYDTANLRKITGMAAEWMRGLVKANNPMAKMFNFANLVEGWDKGIDPICRNAPHVIVAYGHKGNRIAPTDATIALSQLELLAPAYGLGTCWAGYFSIAAAQSPEVKQAIGIPDDHVQLGSMMIGFPKHRYQRVPKRNKLTVTWK